MFVNYFADLVPNSTRAVATEVAKVSPGFMIGKRTFFDIGVVQLA
jgi:hypothetical protein